MNEALPEPISRVLLDVSGRLASVTWLVTGSTARALMGFTTTPRDLDIEVATVDIDKAAAALGLDVHAVEEGAGRSLRATGMLDDVEVDLTAGLTIVGPGGVLPPDFDLMARSAATLPLGEHEVRVAPLEEQIVRILISGNEARRARFVREAPDGWIPLSDYVERRLGTARAAR